MPPKVKVLAWKLTTDTLAVQAHRCRRNMDVIPTCQICGTEPETAHHAMVVCPKSRALRLCLKEPWYLPTDSKFIYTGTNWVLILLNQCSEDYDQKFFSCGGGPGIFETILSLVMANAE